jgi:hypothetical protein
MQHCLLVNGHKYGDGVNLAVILYIYIDKAYMEILFPNNGHVCRNMQPRYLY